MTGRVLGTLVALSLFPAAAVYFGALSVLFFLLALGAFSIETILLMGAAGAAALLCLVLAVMILIRPRRNLVMGGAAMSAGAVLLYLASKQHLV